MRGRRRVTAEEAARALAVFGPGQDGEKYRAAFPEATAEELYVQVQTDWLFRMPALQLAEAQTAGGGRASLYEIGWRRRARAACSARATASTCRCCSEPSVPALARCSSQAARRGGLRRGRPAPPDVDDVRRHRRPRLARV